MTVVALGKSTRQLGTWLRDVALPYWAVAGRDNESGLFHERLLPNGEPDRGASLRVRVQARQIYTYAHAAVLRWYPEGASLALRAFDALLLRAESPDGMPGFVHRLAPRRSDAADRLRDSYDHAFLVLAFAWLFRATGEPRVEQALQRVIDFVDTHLTAPDGSLREGTGSQLPRRQNPQMHWFEAMLALMELGRSDASDRAQQFRTLFESKLFDAASATLGEYFTNDWTPAPGMTGTIIEPGHQAEWIWLLYRHEELTGKHTGTLRSALLASTLLWRDATGMLVDEATRDGGVLRSTRRSWLQTEMAKAWLAEAAAGRAGALGEAASALCLLQRVYLGHPLPGGWVDQMDAAGQPLPITNVSASTFYHIFVAGVEAERVLAALKTSDEQNFE